MTLRCFRRLSAWIPAFAGMTAVAGMTVVAGMTAVAWVSVLLVLFAFVPVSAAPVRIVSLSPVATEILFALGAGKQVVAVSPHCNYPEAVNSRIRVRVMPLDVEGVAALRPDAVIGVGNDAAGMVGLRALGIRTLSLPTPYSIRDVLTTITAVGVFTGRQAAAQVLNRRLEMELQALRGQSPASRPSAVIVLSVGPLMSVSPATYLSEIAAAAGARNIVRAVNPRAPILNLEYVVRENPRLFISTSADFVPAILKSDFYALLHGAPRRIVTVPDPDLILRPGPRMVEGIRRLRSAIERATKDE